MHLCCCLSQVVALAVQFLVLHQDDKPLDGFGSVLANFAETAIGHVFHPEASFGENMLIVDRFIKRMQKIYTCWQLPGTC